MTEQYTNRSYYQALADAGHNITKVATADILALYARIDELEAMVANLNEGAKIMHAFATGGESKLVADWQDEKTDFNLSAEQADLAEHASGCWTSYTPSAKEISKRVQEL